VYSLAGVVALEAEPGVYADRLAAEVPGAATLPELEARDAFLIRALGQIDAMLVRAMKVRLEHALADDRSIAAPTRSVFAHTVASYAGRLSVLEDRAREVAARGGAADPGRVADAVVSAARSVLGLREAVLAGVLALTRDLAQASVADADRRARDRNLDESVRRRWSAARRDLEAVALDPGRVLTAAMGARVGALPEQLDEPAPGPELTFADFLELD
jgi:hypothetical protein